MRPMKPDHIEILGQSLGPLFDQAPALTVLLRGAEHRFAYANPSYLLLIGRDAVVGRTVACALPELAEQGFVDLLDQVYATGEPFVGEGLLTRIGSPDGPPRDLYFDFVYQPVFDADGAVVGIFGQGTDVTERVVSEATLRESEARLELATRAANVGIWDWNLETGTILFDARARAIWGFEAEGPVTQAMMAAAMHPEDVPETNERFRRATDPDVRDRSAYEYRVRRAAENRWVRAHAEAIFALRDGAMVAIRCVGTMEDITKQKAREEALKASESRLRLALDAGRMAIWAIEPNGEVVVTPEFNRLLGLADDAHPTLAELQARYYPGELERLQALSQAALARGDTQIEFEYRHRWPDDDVRWLLVRAEFQFNPEGEPVGAIGVVLDITERKEAEERLQLLAREVDHRANNLMSVVQASIALTHGSDVAAYQEALLGRVTALGRSHQLLAASRWQGADLRTLVEEELRPYQSSDGRRVRIEGPAATLPPATAQAVAMVVHELATNAAKYGALSVTGGALTIDWRALPAEERWELVWTESGGPPVSRPAQRGMGMQVVERSLRGALRGGAHLEWRPEGLICRLSFALE